MDRGKSEREDDNNRNVKLFNTLRIDFTLKNFRRKDFHLLAITTEQADEFIGNVHFILEYASITIFFGWRYRILSEMERMEHELLP